MTTERVITGRCVQLQSGVGSWVAERAPVSVLTEHPVTWGGVCVHTLMEAERGHCPVGTLPPP